MTTWNNIILFNRQTRPASILAEQRSLLLYHSPGSGKTYAALHTIDELTKLETTIPNVIVIAPAKVITEVWSPVVSRVSLPNIFTLTSYELARSRLSSIMSSIEQNRKAGIKHIVICDEVHNVRNVKTKNFHATFAIASKAYKLLLLSGTPIINSVDDTLALVRLLHNDARIYFKSFDFVDPMTLATRNLRKFREYFRGYVDAFKLVVNEEDYPTKTKHVHSVNMYPLQKARYRDFISKLLTPALQELMEQGIITNALNPFLVRTRAISNTLGKFMLESEQDEYEESEKFIGIRDSIVNGPKPAIIYSFFRSNGVIPLQKFLDKTTDLRTSVITGDSTDKEIKRSITNFNAQRTDIQLITSTVKQGISFFGARQFHVTDPPWNESTLDQIIARAIRYRSHAHLPPEERHVDVHMWITHYGKMVSTDEYIYDLAERKQKVNEVFEQEMISS